MSLLFSPLAALDFRFALLVAGGIWLLRRASSRLVVQGG